MTSSVFNQRVRKANWLGRYLEVESKANLEVRAVLEQAERDITKRLAALGDETFSDGVRRAQLNLALKAVRENLTQTFGSVTDIIRNRQETAAVAAIDAGLFDQRGILKKLFPDVVNRRNYADSLRETATRNIQATIVRVLETQQPLSGRVWKTNALANGLVSKAVNNALARGDSAQKLAKEISGLVNPNVPGGVSYAAMRLARTEINNAFHAQSILDAQQKPWLDQMRWNLSKVHAEDPGDACELYAQIGLFNKERVPPKPHPNCRCFVTAEIPDYQEFEDNLVLGHYNQYIDSIMGDGYTAGVANKARQSDTLVMPSETEPVARPVAETGVQTQTFDHWTTVEDLAWEMENAFGVDVGSDLGWSDLDMDLRCAKELANQYAVLANKYPEVELQYIENFMFTDSSQYAITYPGSTGARSHIALNKKWWQDYDLFAQSEWEDNSSEDAGGEMPVGFHPKGAHKEPAKATFTHEWAHAMDNWIMGYGIPDWDSTGPIMDLLWNDYKGVYTGFPEMLDTDEFPAWWDYLRKNLSGYSFEDKARTSLDRFETLAEAFDDVERNGDNAFRGSKLVYDYFMMARQWALNEQKLRLSSRGTKR